MAFFLVDLGMALIVIDFKQCTCIHYQDPLSVGKAVSIRAILGYSGKIHRFQGYVLLETCEHQGRLSVKLEKFQHSLSCPRDSLVLDIQLTLC